MLGCGGRSTNNACASEEVKRVDEEMNETYRNLLSAVSNNPYEPPEAVETISNVQKAWAAYRDAYMQALFPAENRLEMYGSIYPMTANLVRATLTRQHIEALNVLLRHYNGEPGY